jgi:DNA-binding winged helix-turn-helix (wHTH) protein
LLFAFEDHTLDTDRRELRRGSTLVSVQPQVFDLLVFLIHNRDHVVSRDDLVAAVWDGRAISESTIATRINAARRAIGDTGEQQTFIRTVPRRGIRFVGAVRETSRLPSGHDRGSEAPPQAISSRQEVRFCTAPDGVRIAFAQVGQGVPLVKAGNWLNHLEYDWKSPVWSPFFHRVASKHRLLRYDARGNGLSDWDIADFSFEAFVSDLESIVDAAGVDRFALLGMSQGCAVSIAYAVRHPGRVSHLVLYGGFARGRRKRGVATGRRRLGCGGDADPPRLGSGEPGFPPVLHLPLHAGSHRRADAILQRHATYGDLAGECRAAAPVR